MTAEPVRTRQPTFERLLLPAVVGVLLVAFAARVYRLDAQSLWHDEGLSLELAQLPLPDAVAKLVGVDHPPLYFLLLRGWLGLGGDSDFAARFFSVLVGVAIVAAIYALGRRLGGWRLGIIAAVLAAASPFYVHYAQEVRMYALVVLLAVVSFHWLDRAMAEGGRAWLGYTAVTLLALFTHYAALFLVAAEAAYFVVAFATAPPPRRPKVGPWLASQAVLAAAVLVWLLIANPLSAIYPMPMSGTDVVEVVRQTLVVFSLGHGIEGLTVSPGHPDYAADRQLALVMGLPILALVIVGAFERRLAPRARLALVLWLVLPLLLAYASSSLGRRDFSARYLAVASPAFVLLAASGLRGLAERSFTGRTLALVAAIWTAGAFAISLSNYYGVEKYARDDFRGAVTYLEQQVSPTDGIVLDAAYIYPVVRHYLRSDLPTIGLPEDYPASASAVAARLAEFTLDRYSVWLLLWQDYFADPDGLVQGWLDEHLVRMEARSFHGLTLYRYRTAPALMAQPPSSATPSTVRFESGIALLGYEIDASQLAMASRLRVSLFWQAAAPITQDLRVFVHLVNPAHYPFAQKDNRPVFERLPTTAWPVSATVHDEYGLDVAAGTPPGHYYLSVGLYDPQSGRRLRPIGSEAGSALLGPFRLDPPNVAPSPTRLVNATVPGLATLYGFDLDGVAAPGSRLSLVLYWRADVRPSADYTVFSHLVDASGRVWAQHDGQPVLNMYPTSEWQPGRYILDPHELALPADLPTGEYRLLSGFYDARTGQRLLVPGTKENAIAVMPIRVPAR